MNGKYTGYRGVNVENNTNLGKDVVDIISYDVSDSGEPYNVIGFVVSHARKDKRTGAIPYQPRNRQAKG